MTSKQRQMQRAKKNTAQRSKWVEKEEREAFERRMSMSFRRKLDWASKHIEHLNIAQQTWLGTGAYVFVPEQDPKTGRTIVRAKITEPPPPELSLILGDTAHVLRSALDHLALELAVAHHRPNPITPAVEKASEFPIFPEKVGHELGSNTFNRVEKKTGKPARGSGLHKLQGAHPDAIKAIEGIQPYHRGAAYAEDPLWVIHELDRIDKHRRLNLTTYAVGQIGLNSGPSGTATINAHIEQAGHNGPVEDGTPVLIMTVFPDSDFNLNIAKEIALAEPAFPQRIFLVPTLTTLRDYLSNVVVPLLEPWL